MNKEEVNEENVKPKEITKNNKIKKIILLVAAILVVATVFILLTLKSDKKVKDMPIAYVDGEKLILWQDEKHKITIDENFSNSDNNRLNISIYNNLIAYVNDESMYIYNIKTNEKEKIASSVDEYSNIYFSDNGSYLVYMDDENIYSYNLKDKNKNRIASSKESTLEILKVVDGLVYYTIVDENMQDEDSYEEDYEYNGKSLYVYTFKDSSSEKLATKIVNIFENEDETKFVYDTSDGETYSIYILNQKDKKSEKIISNVFSIVNYNFDYDKFIYTTKSKDFDNLLDDEKDIDDKIITDSKEEIRMCTYSDYLDNLCTYSQWWNDEYYTYKVETTKKSVNDEIRQMAKEITYYDVYYYNNGKNEKIASNVTNVYGADVENGVILYEKMSDQPIKMSELKSVEDFEEFLNNNIKMVYNNKDKEVEITADDIEIKYAIITKDLAGYLLTEDGILYYIDMASNSNVLEELDNKVTDIYNTNYTKNLKRSVLYEVEGKGDFSDLKIANEKSIQNVATDVANLWYEYNTIFIYNNCDENYSCSVSKYDKKLETFTTDVNNIKYINDKNFYVFKNYSRNKQTYDIYKYKDDKLIQIAFDIPYGLISFGE